MAGIAPDLLIIKCPPELKDNHWQKKKGKVGKMVKTGLGAELKKLEALMKKVDTSALNPASQNSNDMDELKQRVVEAKKEYMKSVVPLKKQTQVIRAAAQKAEAKLKKVPLGKDASKAAAAVGKAADWYGVTCKSLDLDGAIAYMAASIKRKSALAAKYLDSSNKKFLVGAKKYLALDEPTKDDWNEIMKQNGRSVSNSVAQLPAYRAKFWSEFVKFKGFDLETMGIREGEDFGKNTKKIVKAAAKQVVAIAKFTP